MAGAREEILEAFRRLEAGTGRRVFGLKEVVDEVQAATSAFEESTIRTYVTSVMCADAPVHHTNHTNDLRRVGRGMYARVGHGGAPEPATTIPQLAEEVEGSEQEGRAWHWEGYVQASVVRHLAAAGWDILAVANTEQRSQGTDVVAARNGARLHVEVKGYPLNTYARGVRQGQAKPTQPATQARVWFAGALLKAAMLRNEHPDDLVAMAFPSFETYKALASRVSLTLTASRIGVIWLTKDGSIDMTGPGIE